MVSIDRHPNWGTQRFTFRQGHTVQPFAMVSGKQVCRYQDVSKESQTLDKG